MNILLILLNILFALMLTAAPRLIEIIRSRYLGDSDQRDRLIAKKGDHLELLVVLDQKIY